MSESITPVPVDALYSQVQLLRADLDALSQRAGDLVRTADHVDVERHGDEGERRAIELVDELAEVVRRLRAVEQPVRDAEHHAWSLTLPALRG